jgi:hypothetical protein
MMQKGFTQLFKIHLLTLLLMVAAAHSLRATHLRAGEITLERVSCTELTFRITITVYTDLGSPIKFGEGDLNFGDGSPIFKTPTIDNVRRPDLGPEVGTVSFTTTHTFPGPGKYLITYLEPNRNAGILNMTNSVDTRFFIETQIIIDPFLGCSNTPRLLVPPIDKGCTGAAFYHNPGAYDPDGDSLSYELTIPKRDKGVYVNGYLDPNAKTFYDRIGLNYGTANEAGNGQPTFSINPVTGTLIWDAPGAPGEYNIAFLIKEWRKVQGVWLQIGYVVRDMQIIIEDCLNKRPELEVPADICVEAGTVIKQDIFGFDPDSDSVKIEVFSELLAISPSPATYIPFPAKFQYSAPGVKAKVSFNWATTCDHVQDQPYQVVFKITDKPKTGPNLVQFKTWNIRVVGPAPKWETANINLGERTANLKWESYVCRNNAVTMQVWRRVDQFAFTPPECVTGMPESLGYTKITELPIGENSYKDSNGGKGLAVGAAYCYRLVAVFPQPGGGESYVSQEICLPPILADAPVITNVTVDATNRTTGQVTVRWRKPFNADAGQFPPPYSYEVQRAEGFSGDLRLTSVFPGRRTDTVWVDTGLNTIDLIYNYRVTAFDAIGTRIDVSPTASTVRLEPKPQALKIALSWNADVPWSNNTQDYPLHLIYRGSSLDGPLELIDSVNVNQYRFNYIDSGQYKSQPLDKTKTYCYRVMTRGSYGNPRIIEPLKNFSQTVCAQPVDDEKPCTVQLSIKAQNCEEYLQTASCGANIFSNTLTWNRPSDPRCLEDIQGYKIYKANKTDGEYVALNIPLVRDTFYIDANLPSFAACYKIKAVDRAGNESELSEPFCFDNCPYYELPNVFTPNSDNCNDLFSAFSDRVSVDEDGNGTCGGPVDLENLRKRCARFVQKVTLKVYNRWGKEVYNYQSGSEQTIYIDWDGKDNNGKELSSGVYYYSAEVIFDVVDPSRQRQIIKGWVQIVR